MAPARLDWALTPQPPDCMKRSNFAVALCSSLATLLCVLPVRSQEAQPHNEQQRAQIQQLLEQMKPGAQHEILAGLVGDYQTEMVYKTGRAKGIVNPGKSSCEMLIGGRFLRVHSVGEVLGQSAESIAFLGFDRAGERFFRWSINNKGTHFTQEFGNFDSESNQLQFEVESTDPISNAPIRTRTIYQLGSERGLRYDIYQQYPGSEMIHLLSVAWKPVEANTAEAK